MPDRYSGGVFTSLRVAKNIGRQAVKRVVSLLLKKIVPLLIPLLTPFLVFAFIFGFIYFSLFMLPKFIAESVQQRVIYHTGQQDPWLLTDDAQLYESYINIYENWIDKFQSKAELESQQVRHISGSFPDVNAKVKDIWGGYVNIGKVSSPQDQVKPHAVPWSVLAGLDKVLGDPIITNLPEREPNPVYHYESLKPEVGWSDFELYYYHRWTECDEDGCETFTEEYKHPIKLLDYAKAYDADYEYVFEQDVEEEETEYSYTKIITPRLVSINKNGPYYRKVEKLLAEADLTTRLDTELVLELAVNMDPDFHHEYAIMADYRTNPSIIYFGPQGPMTWPTEGRISSNFGMRFHPILKVYRMHPGIDIAASEGAPVFSAANGIVSFVGGISGYGNVVKVNHGDAETLYAHLSKFNADVGDEVKAGDLIGKVGSTGLSSGPHLHFEVRIKGEYVDPVTWLP